MRLDLFVDIARKALVLSQANPQAFEIPVLFRQDKISLAVTLLEPNPTGGLSNPYQVVDVTPLSLRVAIGEPDKDLMALQTSWTKDEANNRFTGLLDIFTAPLEAAMLNTHLGSLDFKFEIEIIEDGNHTTVLQRTISIKKDLIIQDPSTPAEVGTPSLFADALATALQNSKTLVWTQNGDNVIGEVIRKKVNLSPELTAGRIDNLDHTNHRFVRITGIEEEFELTGLVAGEEGQDLILYNATGYDMTIKHDDPNSTAANRIFCFQNMCYMTPADATIICKGVATFIYDEDESRWLLTGFIGT